MNMMHKAEQSLEQRWKKKVVAASGYAEINPLKELKPHGGQLFNQATSTGWDKSTERIEATRRPVVQPSDIDRVRIEKWPAIHFT